MSQLRSSIEAYLSEGGLLSEERLGEENTAPAFGEDTNQRLATNLEKNLKFNKYLVLSNFVALAILFIAAGIVMFYQRQDPRAVYGVFAFLLLSNFGIIGWLRKLWWEINVMDASMYVLRRLPPDQAAAFISRLYWDFLRSSARDSRTSSERPE